MTRKVPDSPIFEVAGEVTPRVAAQGVTTHQDTAREAGGPCAYAYRKPGLVCPNIPSFTLRLPSQPPRKAWLACHAHLTHVITQMQNAHHYNGELILTAERFQ